MGNSDSDSSAAQRRRRAPNTAPGRRKPRLERSTLTISETVYQRLHAQIISLELPPGTPISEKAIALSEGVSRTPVREAILRLSDENLVEVVPKSGTFVARIPVSALPEAQIARRALEAVTVRSATRLATKSQILTLYACVEKQREIEYTQNVAAFHLADEDFHQTIATIGRLPGLWALIQQVKVQIDRYRCLTLTLPNERRNELVASEHFAVVQAMEKGDEEAAVAAMERHLTGLQLHFVIGLKHYPDYFINDIDLADIADI